MALASLAERARCVWLPFPLLTRALQTILLASAFPPLKDEKPSSAGASSGAAADVSTGGAQVDATSQTNTSTTNLGYAAALLKKAAKVAEEAKVEAVGAVAAGPAESGAVAASERVAEEGEEKTEEKKKNRKGKARNKDVKEGGKEEGGKGKEEKEKEKGGKGGGEKGGAEEKEKGIAVTPIGSMRQGRGWEMAKVSCVARGRAGSGGSEERNFIIYDDNG